MRQPRKTTVLLRRQDVGVVRVTKYAVYAMAVAGWVVLGHPKGERTLEQIVDDLVEIDGFERV